MKLFGAQTRAIALAGVLVGALALPTMAAQSDIDLLNGYIGTWKGSGQLTGSDRDPETVVCRMSFADGTGDKINFSGRCSLAGTQMSMNGTIAYIEAKKHYEAAMSSNVGFTGVAIGVKSGSGILFDLKEKNKDDQGNDMAVSSTINLTPGKIDVDFGVVFVSTGQNIAATIPFRQ